MTGPVPTVFFGSGSFAVPILDALRDAPELTVENPIVLLAILTAIVLARQALALHGLCGGGPDAPLGPRQALT